MTNGREPDDLDAYEYPPAWASEADGEAQALTGGPVLGEVTNWDYALHTLDDTPPDELRAFRPGNELRTATNALALAHRQDVVDFGALYLDFCRDRFRAQDWPQLLLALLDQFATAHPDEVQR